MHKELSYTQLSKILSAASNYIDVLFSIIFLYIAADLMQVVCDCLYYLMRVLMIDGCV